MTWRDKARRLVRQRLRRLRAAEPGLSRAGMARWLLREAPAEARASEYALRCWSAEVRAQLGLSREPATRERTLRLPGTEVVG